jgi:uncharacterized protein with predicted RNA binding PUA domain
MEELRRLRGIAEYQFGAGCGEALFPECIAVEYSRRTGRLRHVFFEEKLVATLKPDDGFLALTVYGAELLLSRMRNPGFTVTVKEGVEGEIAEGKSVFAKHVVAADPCIRPGDEIVVLDGERRVIAVGKALLNGEEMLVFRTGVAVKVRRGRLKEESEQDYE